MGKFLKFLTESADPVRSYVEKEIKSIWDDMDTSEGRNYAANAPKKLVKEAMDKFITNKEIERLKKIIGDKNITKFFNEEDSDDAYDILMDIHRKVFKYVKIEGDKKKWADKWGRKWTD
jgi:hypothetical protein